jgi:GntR family transcriptional regulator
MAWSLNSERPIYAQIIERIQLEIISGHYSPGDKIPSVRDLASEAAVNPNTMQKALTELEKTGLVATRRTSGRYITEDIHMIQSTKKEIAADYINEFLDKLKQLGFKKEEIVELVLQLSKEDET